MKRLFVFAASAMMVFASCTDHEIVYQNETPQEIGLFPVSKNMTRAAIDGTSFTHGNMIVAAYLASGTGVTPSDYFDGTVFTKAQGATNFTGGKYWPIQASVLNFLAVAPVESGVTTVFGSKETADAPKNTKFAKTATVTVANNQNNQYDVMYAIAEGNKANSNNEDLTVGMKFNHALAWINFTFKATSPGITINNVNVNGANYNGTLTVTQNNYHQTEEQSVSASWSNLSGLTKNDDDTTPSKVVTIENDQTKELTIAEDKVESETVTWGEGLLVAPSNNNLYFVINYTVTVDQVSHTYNYTHPITPVENGYAWAMGKKYTYNISMGLQKIQINPSVILWNDDDADGTVEDSEKEDTDITIK